MWFPCLKFEKSIIIPNNSFGWFSQTSHKLQKAYPFTQHYQSKKMFQENIYECSNFFFEGIKVHVTKMSINLVKKWFELSQLVLAMLLVQLFSAGMQLLSGVILVDGTFVFALMVYRKFVAALCLAPLAFFFERFVTILHYILCFTISELYTVCFVTRLTYCFVGIKRGSFVAKLGSWYFSLP